MPSQTMISFLQITFRAPQVTPYQNLEGAKLFWLILKTDDHLCARAHDRVQLAKPPQKLKIAGRPRQRLSAVESLSHCKIRPMHLARFLFQVGRFLDDNRCE